MHNHNYTDIYSNIKKWEFRNNVLFITGTPGSGKSSLATKMAASKPATLIELDMYEEYYYNRISSDEIHKSEFLYHYIAEHKLEQQYMAHSKYSVFRTHFKHYFYSLLDYCYSSPNQLYILNGVQMYLDLDDWEWLKERPLIIKKTGFIKSTIRRLMRDGFSLQDLNVMMYLTYAYKLRRFEKWVEKNMKFY